MLYCVKLFISLNLYSIRCICHLTILRNIFLWNLANKMYWHQFLNEMKRFFTTWRHGVNPGSLVRRNGFANDGRWWIVCEENEDSLFVNASLNFNLLFLQKEQLNFPPCEIKILLFFKNLENKFAGHCINKCFNSFIICTWRIPREIYNEQNKLNTPNKLNFRYLFLFLSLSLFPNYTIQCRSIWNQD